MSALFAAHIPTDGGVDHRRQLPVPALRRPRLPVGFYEEQFEKFLLRAGMPRGQVTGMEPMHQARSHPEVAKWWATFMQMSAAQATLRIS